MYFKKFIYSFLTVALLASSAIAYNTLVYREQGGSRMVVASGGSFDVQSGGEIDVESGGSLKLAGTSITSTAAELNILDGVTSSAAELNEVDAGVYAADGQSVKKIVRSTYDTQVDGGSVGAYDLGEDLPANAIVTQAWFQVITQFEDGGSGTVALHCASADDLFAAADITGSSAGTITSGVPTGTAGNMFDVGGSACDITATVASAEQTAGKLVLWVEYVVSE